MEEKEIKGKHWVATGKISGTMTVPSSKSIALRYLLLASVAQGESIIKGISYCDDVVSLLSNFEALGIRYTRCGDTLSIEGRTWNKVRELNCGESGFLARTLPFLSGIQGIDCTLEGNGSLLRRDFSDLAAVFEAAAGERVLSETRVPLHIPPLTVREELMVGRQSSSQALSGLLLALPLASHGIGLKIDRQPSEGYIVLTLETMRRFGASFREINGNPFSLVFCPTGYKGCEYSVAGDWSGAAQLIAALQVGDCIRLQGLEEESVQPDRAILKVIEQVGGHYEWEANTLLVRLDRQPRGFSFDASDCPDLFPALAALASMCQGETRLKGVERLGNKESDRGSALVAMLGGFGIGCHLQGDILHIVGGIAHPRSVIPCAHDHRIAMAAGAIALRCQQGAYLDDVECVSKSFPNFFEILSGKH